MLSIDCPPDVTIADATPPAFMQQVKFNPIKKAFSNITEGLTFDVGSYSSFEDTSVAQIRDFATTIPGDEELLSSAITAGRETVITKRALIWDKLPKIDAYTDMDSLDDAEDIEKSFYKATKNQGW